MSSGVFLNSPNVSLPDPVGIDLVFVLFGDLNDLQSNKRNLLVNFDSGLSRIVIISSLAPQLAMLEVT